MTTVTSPRRVVSDRTHTSTRRGSSARLPRRVSGPVSGRAQAARSRSQAARAPRESIALGSRALALVRGLPDHSLIDRLVRGRAWIPVLGVLLAGIVAMQVEILKLGTSMGRTMEQTSTLQSQNESLQAGVAGLADDQRIERLAAAMGMTMPTPDSVVFLSASPNGKVGRAVADIHAPDPAGFANQLAAQAAAAAALVPSVSSSVSGSPTSASGATGTSTGPTTANTTSSSTPVGSGSAPSPTVAAAAPTTATPTSPGPATGTPGSSGAGAVPTPSSTGGGTAATGAAGLAPTGSSQSGGAGGG